MYLFTPIILLCSCASLLAKPSKDFQLSKDTPVSILKLKRSNYAKTKLQIKAWQAQQSEAYKNASAANKKIILSKSKDYIYKKLLEDIFPAWYETPWDFNGTTQTPGEGKIACGYFVNTCLRDVGFKLPRIKLSQQPSSRIIRTFSLKKDISVSSGKSMKFISESLSKSGDGIYIVGLDQHVGFVLVKGKQQVFIHADYYQRDIGVKAEKTTTKNPLSDSKYRMFGKLLSDQMVKNWLQDHSYQVSR